MRLIVLGSAAGGGVPQWNCACQNCGLARQGSGVEPRTQDSLAVSGDGQRWFLLNVSPDVTRQIERTPALWPRSASSDGAIAARHSPIAGAVLTNGDLDHWLGLLSLREWTPLSVYATGETRAGLVQHNAVLRTLDRQRPHVLWRGLELGAFSALCDAAGETSGLSIHAFAVPGKVPLHLEARVAASAETNVGLVVRDDRTGAQVVYVPGAACTERSAHLARDASCLFFDGTFWSDEELAAFGQSPRLAREMAHLPVGGPGGSLERLSALSVPRRYYTHLNNTNPMLRDGSEQRLEVEAGGWKLAHDGLEIDV